MDFDVKGCQVKKKKKKSPPGKADSSLVSLCWQHFSCFKLFIFRWNKGQGMKTISGFGASIQLQRQQTPLFFSLAEGSSPQLECLFSSPLMLEAGEFAHRTGVNRQRCSREIVGSLSLMRLGFFAKAPKKKQTRPRCIYMQLCLC